MRTPQDPDLRLKKIPRLLIHLILIAAWVGQSTLPLQGSVGNDPVVGSSIEQKHAGLPAFPEELEKNILQIIANSGAETVSVVSYDLATGKELLINPDVSFHAASTMKVPVMMEIFRQTAVGKLSLDQRIRIKNDFSSIVDGSHYALSPDSDSEQTLYTRVGQTETIRELMRLMIIVSSNLATNILIELVTPGRIMELMNTIGAKNIHVLRGVEDGK